MVENYDQVKEKKYVQVNSLVTSGWLNERSCGHRWTPGQPGQSGSRWGRCCCGEHPYSKRNHFHKQIAILLNVSAYFFPTPICSSCPRCGDSPLPSARCHRGVSPTYPACQTTSKSAPSTSWSIRRSLYLFLPCAPHETDTPYAASCVTLTTDQTRQNSHVCTRTTPVLCGCCNSLSC